ncbi:MAG: nicotinate-nucleotide diphosphorylase (carboxylating), partial [Deltaproteobacteria bacterium]|nr:nicotinate-nucleotide diphosphorylase (carboxylating) [Deltaproteobacteria bacterium]
MDDFIKLDDILHAALVEDIGAGDLTTAAIVEPGKRGEAVLLA